MKGKAQSHSPLIREGALNTLVRVIFLHQRYKNTSLFIRKIVLNE